MYVTVCIQVLPTNGRLNACLAVWLHLPNLLSVCASRSVCNKCVCVCVVYNILSNAPKGNGIGAKGS